MTKKHNSSRPFSPDFVSAETLAYRLDCSVSTVLSYVKEGLLPRPKNIGNMARWEFAEVIAFIKERDQQTRDEDDYLKGVEIAAPSQA